METGFITVLNKMVEEQGGEVLFNSAKCKSLLADYSKGDYKKEQRLLIQCIETDIPKLLKETSNIDEIKPKLRKRLYDEYFISEDIANDVIALLIAILHPHRTFVLFLVIDSSSEMEGSKIGSVNCAFEEVIPEIREISEGNNDVKIQIAVLSYSSGARWITENGPVNIENFRWEYIEAEGDLDMGAAFNELNRKLSREADGFMHDKYYFVPTILLLCNGKPTDDWKNKLIKLKENKWFNSSIKVALAIGDNADRNVLKEFTGTMDAVLEVSNSSILLKKMIRFIEYNE